MGTEPSGGVARGETRHRRARAREGQGGAEPAMNPGACGAGHGVAAGSGMSILPRQLTIQTANSLDTWMSLVTTRPILKSATLDMPLLPTTMVP